jgi:hypothetical protein
METTDHEHREEEGSEERPAIGENDPIVQHWLEIGRSNRERFPNALGSQDIDEYLYDEHGLPR